MKKKKLIGRLGLVTRGFNSSRFNDNLMAFDL